MVVVIIRDFQGSRRVLCQATRSVQGIRCGGDKALVGEAGFIKNGLPQHQTAIHTVAERGSKRSTRLISVSTIHRLPLVSTTAASGL
jgi:hypothetical protein